MRDDGVAHFQTEFDLEIDFHSLTTQMATMVTIPIQVHSPFCFDAELLTRINDWHTTDLLLFAQYSNGIFPTIKPIIDLSNVIGVEHWQSICNVTGRILIACQLIWFKMSLSICTWEHLNNFEESLFLCRNKWHDACAVLQHRLSKWLGSQSHRVESRTFQKML